MFEQSQRLQKYAKVNAASQSKRSAQEHKKKATSHKKSKKKTQSAHALTAAAPSHQAVAATTAKARPATAPTYRAPTTDSNLEWLAKAIEAEAGGESTSAKVAVGDVILNRVHSPEYPNTIHDVLFQVVEGHYAFTCVQNGWIYHTPSQASLDAAKAVLYRRENIVPDALVFYVNSATPANSWVRTRPIITVIGDMYFAK